MKIIKPETQIWEEAFQHIYNHTFRLEIGESSGTGFYFATAIKNDGSKDITIGTALHVIEGAEENEDTLRLWGRASYIDIEYVVWRKHLLVNPEVDLAFFGIPTNLCSDIPEAPLKIYHGVLPIGTEIAWCGYPSICISKLCLFHGYVSTNIQNDYLLDGVAINGISGGPAFVLTDLEGPLVCGLVTEYRPNRVSGDVLLPGLTYLRSMSHIFSYLMGFNASKGYYGAVIRDYRNHKKETSTK